ncbi:hypothetical protein VN23_02430 [Janthinobacterium sp. B9-8]|nr:hypothetical protein VN23_02430 [Janthinobacterium sp. B9-8]
MVFSKQHKGARRLYRVPTKAEQIHENARVFRQKNLSSIDTENGKNTEHTEKPLKVSRKLVFIKLQPFLP